MAKIMNGSVSIMHDVDGERYQAWRREAMKTKQFIREYEKRSVWERAEEYNAWIKGLYELAKNIPCAEVRDEKTMPGTCCPCVRFDIDGYSAVGYLYSGTLRPAMHIEGKYVSMDYRLMLDVLRGHFVVA